MKEHLGPLFIDPPPFDLASSFESTDVTTPLIFLLSPGSDPFKAFLNFAEQVRHRAVHALPTKRSSRVVRKRSRPSPCCCALCVGCPQVGMRSKLEGVSLGKGQGALASKLIEDAKTKGKWVLLQVRVCARACVHPWMCACRCHCLACLLLLWH